jgi:hypothetical protein
VTLDLSEARAHAVSASQLLENATSVSAQFRDLSPERRLEFAANGGFARANADLQWTLEVAAVHALTALALALTDLMMEEPDDK